MENNLTWEQFMAVDLRVGTIIEASAFPEARKPAYKLKVDLGELGIKKSSAQITHRYTKEELVGQQVICVTNFPPKQIGPWLSEVLVTGFEDEEGFIVLSQPQAPVPNGKRLI
ncbi:tRNA-binding protein [Rufibacter glacialis]|uniref:tRNA-binding protein n=1 Tax=Rufibacter glacialis TaxID=1259555 RepID=A0A5M8QAD2_9BACT|nr:tRNA-binding protein [Rufibacter glacialis]KAA6431786.1 tRNA-binding protein [Rufibacter glacialis]GGK81567.1 tRNA-binding protein [Rufibacter glacialis]